MLRISFLVFAIVLFLGRASQAQDNETAPSKSAAVDQTKEGTPTLDEDKKPTPEEQLLLNSSSGSKAPEGLYLLVRHPNRFVRLEAFKRLLSSFAKDPEVYRFYIEQMNGKDTKVRESAFIALYSFYYYPDSRPPKDAKNQPPKEFMKSIINAVSDPEFNIHKYGAYLIGFYHDEPEAKKTTPTLLKLSKNYNDAAFFAIHSLGLFGEQDELLRHYETSQLTKFEIALALALIDPASEKVVEILEQEISKDDIFSFNYRILVDAFATVRPSRKACLDQIEKATKSEDKRTREQAVNAFAKISPEFYKSAIPILEKIASDPNSSEKALANKVLGQIKSDLPERLPTTSSLTQEKTTARSPEQLRGEVTPERAWWDLLHYELAIEIFPETKSIEGSNQIKFRVLAESTRMQIDLQPPLKIKSVLHNQKPLQFEREGNVCWIDFPQALPVGSEQVIEVKYGGVPHEAANPPWEGGLIWKEDDQGNPFIATSCQGLGASVWWPCKDHGSDEPDEGLQIRATVPEDLKAVSNGRLVKKTHSAENKTRTFLWQVKNPINNYSVSLNIGNYVHFADKFTGEDGPLDVDYWVLKGQTERAKAHFKEVPRTLKAFEHWFGKYPFYEDSYKLVVVPYSGMEHQSAVSYGNKFANGYGGRDLSATGVGMKFDFIIVHESGHEWFGNSLTSQDIADMWIHESFTNYSETLFIGYHFTQKEANDYVIGCRKLIQNDKPIIGKYNLHQSGSKSDMYYKGGNMLHMIRQIVNDDEKFRALLRGLNKTFFHQTITTKQVEDYMSENSGIDLSSLFDQYLRHTEIPTLAITFEGKKISYQFENCIDELSFPVKLDVDGKEMWITPTTKLQTVEAQKEIKELTVDRNFYLESTVNGKE